MALGPPPQSLSLNAPCDPLQEREALSEWLRGGNEGGVIALAKRLNKSRSYVEQKLRHFETTNKGHRYYVPPSPASTIRTRPPTARAENMVRKLRRRCAEKRGLRNEKPLPLLFLLLHAALTEGRSPREAEHDLVA